MEMKKEELEKIREREEIEEYLSVMGYSKEELSKMLPPRFSPYYTRLIDRFKKATEKVNKYADPLETLEDPNSITRPGKLLGRKKRNN